ncbi:MAG: hypothetical protein LW825_05415 [Candidatus Jidaibacter sp.]|jgi:hypothetical protein|nr:hypothetical protein [Candidatus Jidaibacter sp.]
MKQTNQSNPIDIVLSQAAWERVQQYAADLQNDTKTAGKNLTDYCSKYLGKEAKKLTSEELLQALLGTKKPFICAESVKIGQDTWNSTEYEILCSVGIMYDVSTYDNGRWGGGDWSDLKVYEEPFEQLAMIVSSPILALQGKGSEINPDRKRIVRKEGEMKNGELIGAETNFDEYYVILEERLLPLLVRASQRAGEKGKKLVLTLPGLGCGAFAGAFRMGDQLNNALQKMLEKNHKLLGNIDTIIFDPYEECELEQKTFGRLKYRVRPYTEIKDSITRAKACQYAKAEEFQEKGDDFSKCKKAKIVAGDGFSIPGNDANGGNRNTDEGAFGAATNSAKVISGIKGKYDKGANSAYNTPFFKPKKYRTWEIAFNEKLQKDKKPLISIEKGFMVLQPNGTFNTIIPVKAATQEELKDTLNHGGNGTETNQTTQTQTTTQAATKPTTQTAQEAKTNKLWQALCALLVGGLSFYLSYKARHDYLSSSAILGVNGVFADVSIAGLTSAIALYLTNGKDTPIEK